MHPYVLDQIGDNSDAYESAKAKDKKQKHKQARQLLELSALMRAVLNDGDALYNSDNYEDWDDEIFED